MTETAAPANILIVDDTTENLRLLTNILEQLGCEVRPVTSGRQALLAAERDPPDLILLDINMPEMNGYEVCVSLKAKPALKDIPVIFLTALSDISDKVKAFEIGGVDYITKPFHVEEVQARVRTHLALRKARLELSESYEKLRQLELLRDELVHMVVHDMRSPLTVLSGHLGFLKTEVQALGTEAAADLQAAVLSVQTLARMANDLLDVNRLEEGQLPLQLAEHDLCAVATEVREFLSGFARGRVIDLAASGPLRARCDRALIYRVLDNLVNNALKHTPSEGGIRISLETRDGRPRVTVTDDGPGVPPDARQRIFEKFGTVAARKDNTYHSTGLGLAFCKLAVEAHGGVIGVDACEPHGSSFWFELPAAT